VRHLYQAYKTVLDKAVAKNPKQYIAEHRLTDNYTRLLGCYELIFGTDEDLRAFIYEELLERFAAAKANEKENALINQLNYLASSGRIKESWQYNYNNNQEVVYVNLNQLYEAYAEYKREKAISSNQFKEILKDYFKQCGGFEVGPRKWYGRYYPRDNAAPVEVNKTVHSYILTYRQMGKSDNELINLFPPGLDHSTTLQQFIEANERTESPVSPDIKDEIAPF
jgi:hypothetical protein